MKRDLVNTRYSFDDFEFLCELLELEIDYRASERQHFRQIIVKWVELYDPHTIRMGFWPKDYVAFNRLMDDMALKTAFQGIDIEPSSDHVRTKRLLAEHDEIVLEHRKRKQQAKEAWQNSLIEKIRKELEANPSITGKALAAEIGVRPSDVYALWKPIKAELGIGDSKDS